MVEQKKNLSDDGDLHSRKNGKKPFWIIWCSVVTTFFIKLLASWLQESERNNTHSSGNFKVSDAATCLYTQNSSSKIADICFNFFFLQDTVLHCLPSSFNIKGPFNQQPVNCKHNSDCFKLLQIVSPILCSVTFFEAPSKEYWQHWFNTWALFNGKNFLQISNVTN